MQDATALSNVGFAAAADLDAIKEIEILRAVVGGETVYSKG
jgi:hypothetical protein